MRIVEHEAIFTHRHFTGTVENLSDVAMGRALKVEKEQCNFREVEIAVIGADHQAFGMGLATKWQFPRHLRVVMGYHHCIDELAADVRELPTLVHIADVVACKMRVGFWLTAHDEELDPEMLASVGITNENIEELQTLIPDELEAAQVVMGLS